MTEETAMWVLNAMIGVSIVWGFGVTMKLVLLGRNIDDVSKDVAALLQMHREPDNTGFGIAPLLPLIKDHNEAIRDLSMHIQVQTEWMKAQRPHGPN